VREINSKSGAKIMTMRYAPKPSAGMPVGAEAQRIVEDAKRGRDGGATVSAEEIEEALNRAHGRIQKQNNEEIIKAKLTGFGNRNRQPPSKARSLSDRDSKLVGNEGTNEDASERSLVGRYLRLLKSREAAALSDR